MAQYLKPDSELGYVEDLAEIEFLKFNNLRHSVLGCMLGDFDELGSYVVSPEIVKELISMEKYIVETYDNIELCRSTLKLDKQISFIVTLEGNKATLSLVEKLNYEANFTLDSGTYSNINEYILDTVETSGEVNRNFLYDRWNIKLVPGNIVDIFNCDDSVLEKYFGIVNRFKYLLRANATLLKKESVVEELESEYAKSVLNILQHYPNLNKAVIDEIKTSLQEKKDSISIKKPFFVKSFNELLENAIQKNLNTLTEQETLEFQQEKHNALVNLNIKRQEIFEIEEIETKDVDKTSLSAKAFQIKYSFEEQRKNLTETAQELVSEHKKVADRLAEDGIEHYESPLFIRTILAVGEKNGNEVELPNKIIQTEKEQLINMLMFMGIGNLVGAVKEVEKILTDEIKEQAKKAEANKKKADEKAKVGAIKFANHKYDVKSKKEKAKQKKKKEEKKEEEKKKKSLLMTVAMITAGTASRRRNQTQSTNKVGDIQVYSTKYLEMLEGQRNETVSSLKGVNVRAKIIDDINSHTENTL